MDNNLVSQANTQFVYNNYAGCAQICDQILATDPCNQDALRYKALSLLMISTIDNFHVPGALKAGEVYKNLSANKMAAADEILSKFNVVMDRIGMDLLQRIKASNNNERNTIRISETHALMKCFETAFSYFPEASNRAKGQTLKMCNILIKRLTGWAHDAARVYNNNRPYNEAPKRMYSGGASYNGNAYQPVLGFKQSEFGVAGFICSFFPFLCYLGVTLCIVGIAAQWKTRRKGLAIAGIVIGIVMSMITAVIIQATGGGW